MSLNLGSRWTATLCAALLLVLGLSAWFLVSQSGGGGGTALDGAPGKPPESPDGQGTKGPASTDERQPSPDGSSTEGEARGEEKAAEGPAEPEGKRPTAVPVKADANSQAKSIAEALKTKTHPERLSAMLPPKAFDADAFARDPEKWLLTHEPGRVFQAAQPGRDVPALRAEGSRFHALKQGESTELVVRGRPGAPVSFTTFDMGTFAENKLSTVTVRADDKGLARATFVASAGTTNDVNILAASPLASGDVSFKVEVVK